MQDGRLLRGRTQTERATAGECLAAVYQTGNPTHGDRQTVTVGRVQKCRRARQMSGAQHLALMPERADDKTKQWGRSYPGPSGASI